MLAKQHLEDTKAVNQAQVSLVASSGYQNPLHLLSLTVRETKRCVLPSLRNLHTYFELLGLHVLAAFHERVLHRRSARNANRKRIHIFLSLKKPRFVVLSVQSLDFAKHFPQISAGTVGEVPTKGYPAGSEARDD